MRTIASRVRAALCAAAVAGFSVTMLTPTPAAARWYQPGWGRHPGWHYGWRGCCWGPRVVVGIAPPVAAVAPSAAYGPLPAGPVRVWIPPHWNGPYWVPGHWA